MKRNVSAFTLTELMVVIAIVSIIMAVAIPMGISWKRGYQFTAAVNNFINAVQVTRVKAIAGPVTMNILYNPDASDSIQGLEGADKAIKVRISDPSISASAFIFTTRYPLSSPGDKDVPIQVDDYVCLVGINEPDFLTGNLYRVTFVPTGLPVTYVTGTKYQYRMDTLWFNCESCSDTDASKCVRWPAGMTPKSPANGKVQVASCTKFTTIADKTAQAVGSYSGQWWAGYSYPPYSVQQYGTSRECIYDSTRFEVKSFVQQIDMSWAEISHPVVFSGGGTTRNGDTYKVEIARTYKGNRISAPSTFIVWPTGRISLETTGVH